VSNPSQNDFRATANPRLLNPNADDAVCSPRTGEAISVTVRFRVRRSTSRKLVAALLGNRDL